MKILAECLTIVAYVYGLICSRYVTDYKKQLIVRIIDDAIWCIIHIFFGNTIAFICAFTCSIFQTLIALKIPILPAVVLIIQTIINILNIKNGFDIFPFAGTVVYCVIILFYRDGKFMKIALFLSWCLFIPYYVLQKEIAPSCVGVLTLIVLARNYYLNFYKK